MKGSHPYADPGRQTKKDFNLSIALKDKINVLIFIHLLAFILYIIIKWKGLLEQSLANRTVDDYIRHLLVISSRTQDLLTDWSVSILTYQFIHFRLGELLLSISMLWLFGHMLEKKLGQYKVIFFYLILIILSAVVFNVSHLIFPIYSGPGGIMEGAFGGVLGIMTTTVFFYGKHHFHVGKRIHFQLWHIYVAGILLSLIWVYKNNMAYILVYACSMYVGLRYARAINGIKTKTSQVSIPGRDDLIPQS